MTTDEAFTLALQHQQSGRTESAETIYRRILAVQPNHARAWHHLGFSLFARGRTDEALDAFRQAVLLQPDSLEAHLHLGNALAQAGRFADAGAAYRRALEIDPSCAVAQSNLGNTLREQGMLDEAIAAQRQAIALMPTYTLAHNNLGNALGAQGRWDEALGAYQRALELEPRHAPTHYNMGTTLARMRRWGEAEAAFRRALELQPAYFLAHLNLGNALKEQERWAEATEAYRTALKFQPENPVARTNLGAALAEQGRFDEAVRAYREVLATQPDYPLARLNHGLLALLHGDFAQGWPLYEARWDVFPDSRRSFAQPPWDGSAPEGKRILIHAEQGFGDSIQFARFVPLVAALGGEVIVECQPPLVDLMRGITNSGEVVPAGAPLPPFDFHVPMLSLPLIFRTTPDTIPQEVPYLVPDAARVATWRERLGERSRLRVGLAWAGDPNHVRNRTRSLPIQDFQPLILMEGIDFFSLQKGPASQQIERLDHSARLIDHTSELGDFADTAALISGLDLVITVDTAIAHLAGALGKRVWTLLAFVPEWRWGLGSIATPWYPTMRLFRQPAPGDWRSVIADVHDELRRLAVESATGAGRSMASNRP